MKGRTSMHERRDEQGTHICYLSTEVYGFLLFLPENQLAYPDRQINQIEEYACERCVLQSFGTFYSKGMAVACIAYMFNPKLKGLDELLSSLFINIISCIFV